MGLASAMTTSLTGLTAAETTIDVVGNNLANSNTVGFKASEANFATQFLQTLSLGSGPTGTSGGTNPRQIGLGTTVADITPDFSQGTIEISSTATDLAIQGEGFFIVQGNAGEQLYTRNGIFKLNSENELINMTGNRVMGFGIDDQFQIQQTTLVPLTIPLGNKSVAQTTENVLLEGTLSPTGDLADTAEVLQTAPLGNDLYHAPVAAAAPTPAPTLEVDAPPNLLAAGTTTVTSAAGGPLVAGGTYRYKLAYYNSNAVTAGDESTPIEVTVVLPGGDDRVQFNLLPLTEPTGEYTDIRIYRTENGGTTDFYRIGQVALGTASFTDDTIADGGGAGQLRTFAQMDDDVLTGAYDYFVTLADSAGGPGMGMESRPLKVYADPLTQAKVSVSGRRVRLDNLPVWDGTGSGTWTHRRIYRHLANNADTYYYVGEIDSATTAGVVFTDRASDTEISGNAELNQNGPPIQPGTTLIDVLARDGETYSNPFEAGTLQFTPYKGGRALDTKDFTITSTSTVLQLIDFMDEAMGIRSVTDDPINTIPDGDPSATTLNPGGSVTSDGRIQLVSNNGVDNAIDIRLSSMQFLAASDTVPDTITLPFGDTQTAVGESAVADFLVYDTLGIPLAVRLTAVMEERDGSSTTYRWFADCADNSPTSGAEIAVGTGLLTFDGDGNFVSSSNATVSIERRQVSAVSPLEFDLDFSQLTGLQTDNSSLAVSRQDGSAAGTLTGFIMGDDGIIRGMFSNGITRDLGRIRLARFSNPNGLEQKGQNLFSSGVNSGLPITGNPGEQGIGTIVAGAVELSNTDIGANLIDLILASTMYRANTRVITTAQQLFDELLALRR